MDSLGQFAERWGWIAAAVVFLSFNLIPALVNKFIPERLAALREREKREEERERETEDRLFAMQEKMLTVVAANTSAIEALTREFNAHLGALTRALDANTRVLTQYTSHGPPKRTDPA